METILFRIQNANTKLPQSLNAIIVLPKGSSGSELKVGFEAVTKTGQVIRVDWIIDEKSRPSGGINSKREPRPIEYKLVPRIQPKSCQNE